MYMHDLATIQIIRFLHVNKLFHVILFVNNQYRAFFTIINNRE